MGSSDRRKNGNPQLENGYTRIASELLEQIYSASLNGSQLRIILFVIRETYGFNRKMHDMSYSYISRKTGISVSTIKREIKRLEKWKIIVVMHGNTKTKNRIGINKKYLEWKCKLVSNMSLAQKRHQPSIESDTRTSIESDTKTSIESEPQDNTEYIQLLKKEKDSASLPSLQEMGIPDDWKELLPGYTIDYRYRKMKRKDGVLFDPAEIDWKGLRE